MYRAMTYEWNDKPSQSEGKPLIIQIALQCFWAVKANVTSPQSGHRMNTHLCLSHSELAHFVANFVFFRVGLPRGYEGGLLTNQQCQ